MSIDWVEVTRIAAPAIPTVGLFVLAAIEWRHKRRQELIVKIKEHVMSIYHLDKYLCELINITQYNIIYLQNLASSGIVDSQTGDLRYKTFDMRNHTLEKIRTETLLNIHVTERLEEMKIKRLLHHKVILDFKNFLEPLLPKISDMASPTPEYREEQILKNPVIIESAKQKLENLERFQSYYFQTLAYLQLHSESFDHFIKKRNLKDFSKTNLKRLRGCKDELAYQRIKRTALEQKTVSLQNEMREAFAQVQVESFS